MSNAAIIAEYNPLHNGHVYHISETKKLTKSDNLICIMSGNFVQRGFPSMIDKWSKTKLALKNGIDLVCELPSVYSISSAEFFAFGAISLLNNIGIIDYVSFGSENDNIDVIMNISKLLVSEPNEFKKTLMMHISNGCSYPKARDAAVLAYFNNDPNVKNILSSSNCILAIEYCKSILRLKSNIKPFAIKRIGSFYNEENLSETFSSSTAIRKCLNGNFSNKLINNVPLNVYKFLNDIYKNNYPHISQELMFPYLKYKICTEKNRLNLLPDVSEGLDKKIIKELENSTSLDEYILKIKSKRYTYSRISRLLCQYFIGFDMYNTRNLRNSPCPYCRVLGFNSKGEKLLKDIKKKSKIPIIISPLQISSEVMELDLQCTKAYSIINNTIRSNEDYYRSPIKI